VTTRYPILDTQETIPTAAGRTLLTDASNTAQRTSLGLGALATASSVDLATQTSGTLAIAQGGTGSTTAAAARTALGVPRSAFLYASDATAESGSATASISGTGASSTFTLSTTNQTVAYRFNATTSPRILLPIPQGTFRIELELGITAASGFTSAGSIYFAAALRPGGGGTPSRLWGAAWNDASGTVYYQDLTTDTNTGGASALSTISSPAANSWMRVVWDCTSRWLSPCFGTGVAGARPVSWQLGGQVAGPPQGNRQYVSDTIGADTQLAIWIQNFDNRSPSITATATARLLVW